MAKRRQHHDSVDHVTITPKCPICYYAAVCTHIDNPTHPTCVLEYLYDCHYVELLGSKRRRREASYAAGLANRARSALADAPHSTLVVFTQQQPQ